MRLLRVLVLVAVGVFTSGVPQVLTAALDDDCAAACDGALDGKHCPPNCAQGICANVHASLAVVGAPCPGPAAATIVRSVVVAQASPRLPMVTAGVFHPPRA
ncbi:MULTISPECIES: hypothetical protein [unclassified Anaeromyxobacter]|uniref:hypothetical protein n=1 Tax=unclassified Anaeromyxobacter TaxID=2620896 RepID=UPI001F573054|nr:MULTISPECIES: hypothetical protein [unclassified Anaeromyxobacter]